MNPASSGSEQSVLEEQWLRSLRTSIEKVSVLQEDEWLGLKNVIQFRSFSKNEVLISEGEVEHCVSYVADGVLRGYFLKDGDEHTIAFTYKGHYCASLGSFMSRSPSRYYIQALSEGVLLSIRYADLQELYDRYRGIERWGRISAEQVLTGFEWRQAELMSFTAEERFRLFMNRSAFLCQQVPQKYIASYLNMTPETFSRLRKQS
jgi:CRP/FNR family transcriptional regulator, anaerobic regulatory protein